MPPSPSGMLMVPVHSAANEDEAPARMGLPKEAVSDL